MEMRDGRRQGAALVVLQNEAQVVEREGGALHLRHDVGEAVALGQSVLRQVAAHGLQFVGRDEVGEIHLARGDEGGEMCLDGVDFQPALLGYALWREATLEVFERLHFGAYLGRRQVVPRGIVVEVQRLVFFLALVAVGLQELQYFVAVVLYLDAAHALERKEFGGGGGAVVAYLDKGVVGNIVVFWLL